MYHRCKMLESIKWIEDVLQICCVYYSHHFAIRILNYYLIKLYCLMRKFNFILAITTIQEYLRKSHKPIIFCMSTINLGRLNSKLIFHWAIFVWRLPIFIDVQIVFILNSELELISFEHSKNVTSFMDVQIILFKII